MRQSLAGACVRVVDSFFLKALLHTLTSHAQVDDTQLHFVILHGPPTCTTVRPNAARRPSHDAVLFLTGVQRVHRQGDGDMTSELMLNTFASRAFMPTSVWHGKDAQEEDDEDTRSFMLVFVKIISAVESTRVDKKFANLFIFRLIHTHVCHCCTRFFILLEALYAIILSSDSHREKVPQSSVIGNAPLFPLVNHLVPFPDQTPTTAVGRVR